MDAETVKAELQKYVDPARAEHSQRFFKTYDGGYAAGDKFLGLTVPLQRQVAKKFRDLSLPELQKLLESPIHEHRLVALIIMTEQAKKADPEQLKQLYDFYLKNTNHINNWDLVDVSAPNIAGVYLLSKDHAPLYKLARSNNLWEKRIAMVGTLTFIRAGQLDDTFALAEILLSDKHDLIHKAVGWMLRCAGDVDRTQLLKFLDKHAHKMPRTALRYCLEHLTPAQKHHYMNLKSVK